MLKYQIDSLEGLEENIAKMYTKKGDVYVLAIDGLPDTTELDGLKTKVEELLKEKKAFKQKYEEAENQLREEIAKGGNNEDQIEALRKSYDEKIARMEEEHQTEMDGLNSSINTMTVDNVATKMAADLAIKGSEGVLLPHIKSRLSREQRNGEFVTVVLDKDGKPSAASIDDLKTEFSNNTAFAPVIVGSNASGGGAGGGNNGGAGKKFSEMSEKERTDLYRTDKEKYRTLRDEENAA